jgi:hypothetical protein
MKDLPQPEAIVNNPVKKTGTPQHQPGLSTCIPQKRFWRKYRL